MCCKHFRFSLGTKKKNNIVGKFKLCPHTSQFFMSKQQHVNVNHKHHLLI